MYKITYDLVAIPAADYLIPNTRQSRHNHQLAYWQIPTLKAGVALPIAIVAKCEEKIFLAQKNMIWRKQVAKKKLSP